MTMQLQDSIFYQGEGFDVLESPFSPQEHGLFPGDDSSACWRGFVAHYAIVDDRLCLMDLSLADPLQLLRFDEQGREVDAPAVYPPLNGVSPVRDTAFMEGNWHYRDLQFPLDYSGTLTLCDLPRQQDNADYWEGRDHPDEDDFDSVIRLTLEQGLVKEAVVVRTPPPAEAAGDTPDLPPPLPPEAGETLPVSRRTDDGSLDDLWDDFSLPDD